VAIQEGAVFYLAGARIRFVPEKSEGGVFDFFEKLIVGAGIRPAGEFPVRTSGRFSVGHERRKGCERQTLGAPAKNFPSTEQRGCAQ
jgi:hypothetical protein